MSSRSSGSAHSHPSFWSSLKDRVVRGLLSLLAVIGGLVTSLLLQAVFSGLSHAGPQDLTTDTHVEISSFTE